MPPLRYFLHPSEDPVPAAENLGRDGYIQQA